MAIRLPDGTARSRGPVASSTTGPVEAVTRRDQALTPVPSAKTTAMPAVLRQRPPILRVALTSSTWTNEAEVALGRDENLVVGLASGEKTPHGLKVLAQATLDAVTKLLGDDRLQLRGASLVSVVGEEAVLALVAQGDGPDLLGSALVRGGPIPDATVRATLNALNRRLAQEG